MEKNRIGYENCTPDGNSRFGCNGCNHLSCDCILIKILSKKITRKKIYDIVVQMETIKLKTNIQCSGCIARVTPFLNEALGENNWEVDINNPSKILTVVGESDKTKVISAVEKAGYKAESLKNPG